MIASAPDLPRAFDRRFDEPRSCTSALTGGRNRHWREGKAAQRAAIHFEAQPAQKNVTHDPSALLGHQRSGYQAIGVQPFDQFSLPFATEGIAVELKDCGPIMRLLIADDRLSGGP